MDTYPSQIDPALMAKYDQVMQTVRATLPPPIGNMPEDLVRRDAQAMDLVVCLAPADETEAALVTQYVVTGAHARYCIWQIGQYSPVSDEAMKLRKQAASLMEQSGRTRSRLLAVQEARYKREAAANVAARPGSPVQDAAQAIGSGGATPDGSGAAMPPAQQPVPAEPIKPAPPRSSPPALRLIQGGLAS
jgi:glucosamine 6-phosphate synthetase-like amidotransferase/phosphosugar isomerase protein